MKTLIGKKIIILCHVLTSVPGEDLKEYCLKHGAQKTLFIAHPLFFKEGRPGPYYELYEGEKLIKKVEYKNKKFPGVVQYIKDYFLSLYWILCLGEKWDVMIALDNLNTLAGLTLRKVGYVRRVVYYTIDFVPKRFENRLLNEIYHKIAAIALRHADYTWNLTKRVAQGRESIRHLHKNRFAKQIIVPIGIWLERIPRNPFPKIDKHTLVYAGGLVPHQGVQIVLASVPLVVSKVPDFKFKVIGMGSYEEELRRKVKELQIEKYVQFLGYLESHQDVEGVLAKCGLGIAMYSEELDKWSYYADPSKIKSYLACGLPIITTSLTHIAKDLKKNGCGVITAYDKKEVANAIIEVMANPKKQAKMREQAWKMADSFDWNNIYTKALEML